jgi:hypothetical protein
MSDLVPPEPPDRRIARLRTEALAQYRRAWNDAATSGEIDEQDRVMSLDPTARSTVYQEKYALFRHFDVLQWQVPGLVFAVGGALFGFSPRMANGLPHFLATGVYGLFALAGSYLMHRIRLNLRDNNRVLRRYAMSFGDFAIQPPPRMRSASTLMHRLLFLLGIGSLVLSIASAL